MSKRRPEAPGYWQWHPLGEPSSPIARCRSTKLKSKSCEDHGINNPLQSPHPGGLLVGMADASVQFISQAVDLEVLLRLAIRDDGVTPPLP